MTTASTTLLGLALPVTGELSGTWGDTVNNSITNLLDTAVAGTTTLSTDGDVILTTTSLASNQARQAILLWTANGTTTRNITAPAQSKIYTVINASAGTQSIVLRGSGPTTGVTIVKGESAVCAWNGSDFIKISNTSGAGVFTSLTVSGSATFSGGTANGVAYLNGSKVLTTGSALSFDGTNLTMTGAILAGSTAQTVAMFAGTTASNNTPRFEANGTTASVDPSTAWVRANTIFFTANAAATVYGRFNSGGNFGINVDPAAWSTTNGTRALQIGSGSVTSVASLNDVSLISNVYYDASNVAKYLNSTWATQYRQVNGEHWWLTAASGTAGATATMTQLMTLKPSGDLGVNATNPLSLGAGYTAITISNTTGGGICFTTSGALQGTVFNGAQNMYIDCSTSSGNLYIRNTSIGAQSTFSPYGILGLGGVTPSTWYSGFSAIEISAAGGLSGSNAGAIMWGNSYLNASAQIIRKTAGYTTRYVSAADVGQHLWYTGPYAASGGGTVTETNVASIDASGNMAISGMFNSTAGLTISALNTGYQVGQGAFAGMMVARDNTYGGSGLWVQDPNGNGGVAVSAGSSWVNGAYTVYYSGGLTYIKKTSGNVPVAVVYTIVQV